MHDLDDLARRLDEFTEERDWAQFHTPKNLAMALAGEVGELIAEFQWLTSDESNSIMATDEAAAARIRSELADVTIYLVRLASVLGVNLVAAAHAKIDENAVRYNPHQYRGSARKARASD
jgi:NTP pyrophosphatase (non-canonical NTP hydrolase)